MVSALLLWGIFLTSACNLRLVSAASFNVIKVPLFLSPLTDVPRPDSEDDDIDSNLPLYTKATIYDDWNLSVYDLERILSDKIKTVISDVGVLYERQTLIIEQLTVYNCTKWCHHVNISDVARVTGKTAENLKGNPNAITVREMHDAVVSTMEDIYCFSMTILEGQLGMKSTNVTETEWALFVPEIVNAAIQCRADRLGVTVSELGELLRLSVALLNSFDLTGLTTTFFPNVADLEARIQKFETLSFDTVVATKSWTSAQGQAQPMLYFADDVAGLTIRDLEILYNWNKAQLFAIENISLSSFMGECSLTIPTSVSLFEMSKLLFGYNTTLPSCNVAYVLSRSLNEVENKFVNLATIEDRNSLQVFMNATDITSWFQMDDILQLNIDEGIWIEIPSVSHVASAGGQSTTFIRTCSLPQVIASIKSLNQSGTSPPSALAINIPSFQALLLTTYGYTQNELANASGLTLQQISDLSVVQLHSLILDQMMQRYNFTDLAGIFSATGVDSYVLSTLPSFVWPNIVRAAIQGSFGVAADALSVSIASASSDVQIVVLADGNPSVQVVPGSNYLTPRVTRSSLATCLLGRNENDIYSMLLPDYHKLFKENIVPIVRGKIILESQTLISLLSADGLTLEAVENRTVAQVIAEQTGLSVQQLGCLYGWDSTFLDLVNQITWGNVSAFRICSDYQTSTLHVILTMLLTSQPKNCFGYVALSPSSYSVTESTGFVDVTLDLVGGAVDSVVRVRLSVLSSTATVVKDFQNLTDVSVTYGIGESGIKTVRVNILDDNIVENDEQFAIVITSLDSQTKVLTSLATITILDDDFVSVAFDVDSHVVNEDVDRVVANAVLTGEIERTISVSWSVKDTTTTSSDYQVVSAPTITFSPNGPKTIAIEIVIADDSIVEGPEAFILSLSSTDTHVNTTERPILIRDNDKLSISFVSSSYSVDENQGEVALGVRALGALSTTVNVRLRTLNDDATGGIDYVAVDQTVSFLPSANTIHTLNVPVTIRDDSFIETSETFTAVLEKANANDELLTIVNPSETTVTISDDDKSTVNVKSATYSVPEAQGFVTITVTLVGSLEKSVSVGYTTAPGTASTSDFTSVAQTLQFNPSGSLEQSFNISIHDDTFVEGSEQFQVILSLVDPQAVIGNQGQTTVTISDNDVASAQFVSAVYQFPENIGTGELGVRLTNLTGPLQTDITVSVQAFGTSATLNIDYTDPSPTIVFNAGDLNTIKNISLPIINDTVFEVPETISVVLSNSLSPTNLAIVAPSLASVTIIDEDNVVISFTQPSFSASEGAKVDIQLQVTSGQLGTPVTVSLTATPGTAVSSDYTVSVSSVTFSAGETGPKNISIDLVDDTLVEPTETFTVSLSSSPSVTLASDVAVLILDNDAITVTFTSSSYEATEGNPAVRLQLLSIGQTTVPLSVSVALRNSTATAVSDYTPTTQVVTFNSGETGLKDVTINITDDSIIEPSETFFADLVSLNLKQVNLGAVSTTVITINDNDFATVEFSSSDFTGNETSRVAEVRVILTGTLENNVEVRVSTASGTATAGVDYESLSDYPLTFVPGGSKEQLIRINVTDDNLVEGIERFTASLSSPSSFTKIGTRNVTTVRLVDNDAATISFVDAPSLTVPEGQATVLNVEVTGPLNTQVTTSASVTGVSASITDYTIIGSTTLTFGPGLPSTLPVAITTTNDTIVETDETIRVVLTASSTSVKLTDEVITVTIQDDDKAKVSLSRNTYTGSESNPNVEISVQVVGQLETSVTASLSLSPNAPSTALSTDYQPLVNSVVTFTPGGTTSENRTITIVDDEAVESPETFSISLAATSSGVEVDPIATALILVEDNDAANIGFLAATHDVSESDRSVSLTIQLATVQALQRQVSFRFSTANKTAFSPNDYAEVTIDQLQFNVGEGNGTTRVLNIDIQDDNIIEDSETFLAQLTAITADTVTSGTTTITIRDNDVPSIRLLAGTLTVEESTSEVTIRAILFGSLDRNVTAIIKTSNLTAMANVDYEPVDQQIMFTPGATLQEVKIKILDDGIIEGSEEFLVTLTSSDATVASPGNTTITISDNDVLTVTFSSSSVGVSEADPVAVINLSLTGTLAIPVTFTAAVADGTAKNGADYSFGGTSVTVNPGQESPISFTIPVNDDSIVEDDESFTVSLSDSSPLVATTNTLLTVTIADDDKTTVNFSSSSYSVKENEVQVNAEIESSNVLETSVTVRVTSVDGTAVSGVDYVVISGQTVTFSAGDTKKTLPVFILNEDSVEDTERLTLSLSAGGSSKVLIGSPNVTEISIQDDDEATVQMDSISYSVDEGANTVVVRARLNAAVALARSLTFRISTANGTALSPRDFASLNTVGTFPVGSENGATLPFSIVISDDDIVESTENFVVQLSTFDAALKLTAPSSSTISVTDNDAFEARFVNRDRSVNEEDTNAIVSVQLIGQHERTVNISLATIPGTATARDDYSPVITTLSFSPGVALLSTNIRIVNDVAVEGTETFQVLITTTDPQVNILAPERITISIIDTDKALFSFNQSRYTVEEGIGSSTVWVLLRNQLQVNSSVSVSVYTFPDTAANPADYSFAALPITLTFYGGQSQILPVNFNVANDSLVENDESFYVLVTGPGNVEVVDPFLSRVFIRDDDVAIVGFTQALYTSSEAQAAIVEIRLTNSLAVSVTVSVRTSVGTAVSADFGEITQLDITFNPGDVTKSVSISVVDDSVIESVENFTVSLATVHPRVVFSRNETTVSIQDNDALTVSFERPTYTVSEDNLFVDVVIVIAGSTSFSLRVGVVIEEVTARSGSDFVESGTLEEALLPGEPRHVVRLRLINDENIEKNETFTLRLSNLGDPRINVGATGATNVSISDDDAATVEFVQRLYSVSEAASNVTVFLNLTGILDEPAVVRVSSSDISATSGQDYNALVNEEITFTPGGSTLQTITLTVNNDTLLEGTESLSLTVSSLFANVRIGRNANTTVRIIDDDVASVEFVRLTAAVSEADGTFSAEVEITGNRTRPVNVSVTSADGGAVAGRDYPRVFEQITFLPSDTLPKSIEIAVTNDNRVELDETFELFLTTNDTQLVITDNKMTVRIIDNDVAAIRFEETGYVVGENVGILRLGILLSGDIDISVSASVSLSLETAESSDFFLPVGSVTFNPGTTKQEVRVFIVNDDIVEASESLLASLTPVGPKVSSGSPTQIRVTINDDDVAHARFELSNYVVNESVQVANVTVVLDTDQPLERDARVGFSTESDSASSPGDFNVDSLTLIFREGDNNGTIKSAFVTINNDQVVESSESFSVKLSLLDTGLVPVNPSTAAVTIIDDDKATVRFSSTTYSVDEDKGPANLLVLLSGTIERTVSARLSTASQTATGQDFVEINSLQVAFSPGDPTFKTITVNIVNDAIVENSETFTAALTEEDGVDIPSADSTATITINDNDVATLTLEASTVSVAENVPNVVALVKVSGSREKSLSVTVSTFDVAATATSGDYDSKTEVVTLSNTDVQREFTVTIQDDSIVEGTERFGIRITSTDPQIRITSETLLISITDNDKLTLQLAQSSYSVDENVGTITVPVQIFGTTAVQVTGSVLRTTDVTARNPADYTEKVESLVISPGETTKNVSIEIRDDETVEIAESFLARLDSTNSEQIAIGSPSSSIITINDNDALSVSFERPNYVFSEGAGLIEIGVLVSGSTSSTLQVGLAAENLSANATTDYELVTSTVSLAPGSTRLVASLRIVDDNNLENNETFSLVLSNLGDSRIRVTAPERTSVLIVDDDVATIQFTQDLYNVNENVNSANVSITLTGSLEEPATVRVSSVDNSALAGSDYEAVVNQEVTFTPTGTSAQVVTVTIKDDNLLEGSETFSLALSSSFDNIRIGAISSTTVRIIDDDVVSVEFVKIAESVREAGVSVQVGVEITGLRSVPVGVQVNSSDLSANVGPDYTAVSTSLTFQPSDTVKQVNVFISGDMKIESNEMFSLVLSTTDSGVRIGDNVINITIIDDDFATIRMETSELHVNESSSPFELGILLTGDNSIPLSARVSVSYDTATASDISLVGSGDVTFSSGGKRQSVTLSVLGDSIVEATETIVVTLVAVGQKVVVGTPDKTTVSIEDDDVANVHFESSSYNISEGDINANLTAVLVTAFPLGRDVSVRYSTESGTAVSPGDFSAVVGSVLVFKAGESNGARQDVIISLVNDQTIEFNETFEVTLFSMDRGLVPATPSAAIVTIVDNDVATVEFLQSASSVLESNGQTSILVLLSGTIQRPVSASVATADNTATSPADYSSITQQLTFNPGGSSLQTIEVSIVDDELIEGTETFTASLSPISGVSVRPDRRQKTVSIIDDDTVTVTLEPSTVLENAGIAVIFVRATGSLRRPISVNVFTFNISATSGNDYNAKTEAFVLDSVNPRQPFIVTIRDDDVVEDSENFGVNITTADAQVDIPEETLIVTIRDNDKLTLQIGQSSYTVSEDVGTVTVSVTAAGTTEVPVAGSMLKTQDGSAASPADYSSVAQNLTFLPGEASKTYDIIISNDGLTENAENFSLLLSSTNANQISIGAPSSAVVLITDDDVATVRITPATYSVAENTAIVNLNVSLLGDLAETVRVSLNTQDGTATSGNDYVALVDYPIIFTPGRNSLQSIPVNITDDSLVEGPEEFTAVLTSDTVLAQVVNLSTATIQIIDDDVAGIQFAVTSLDINEDDGLTSVAVEASGGLNTSVTVTVTLADGVGVSGDYSVFPTSITMTFVPNGAPRQFFNITPVDDSLVERDETITATLSTTDPSAVINTPQMVITIKDNDKAIVTLTDPSLTIREGEAGSVTLNIDLQGNISVPVSVSLKTSDGTAVAPDDYTAMDLNRFFVAGVTTQSVTVPVIDDSAVESPELFSVDLTSSDASVVVGTPNKTNIVILDNDEASLQFQSQIYSVAEGMGNVTLTIVLRTNVSLERPVTASFTLRNGTAVSPEDFPTSFGTFITFTAGDNNGATRDIVIPIADDSIVEPVQSFQVSLVSVDNIINPATATVQVTDNDDVAVHFTNDRYYNDEDVPNAEVGVTVDFTSPLQKSISIRLETSNNTAISGEDYVAVFSIFEISPSDGTMKVFSIPLVDDALYEDEENFRVHLSSSDPSVRVTSPSTTNLFIVDNDNAVVRFEKDVYFAFEDRKSVEVCVLTSTVLRNQIVVRVSTISGTAKAALDFDANTTDITLNSTAPRCFNVILHDDSIIESNETFLISLASNNPRVSIPNRITTVHIIDDDVNECVGFTHDCHENAFCNDTEDSFTCTCKTGFIGNGRICVDVDECTLNVHNCHENATCVNDVGSFHCECNRGYTGDAVNSCVDIIECDPNPNSYPCHRLSQCMDTAGSFVCFCPPGFTGDGYNFCNDTDECSRGIDNCHELAICQNTPGSFTCQCLGGFSGNGQLCFDIDECADGTHDCHAQAMCNNTAGSFECLCKPGFTGDGRTCAEIDECSRNPCDTNASCNNTVGSFTCACNLGYTGDGLTCGDIDECASSSACHTNALCNNTDGSFDCSCKSGFFGDGRVSCADLDECALKQDNCHINGTCKNTLGSFNCACNSGFTGDGVTCTNINECQRDACHPNASCIDLIGSFLCQCNSGFTGNGTYCQDNIECIPTSFDWPCHQKATCVDIPGSFVCSCRTGFTGDGFQCEDIDECTLGTHDCHQNATCLNQPGSFDCQCKSGFISNDNGRTCFDYDECNATNPCNATTSVCENLQGNFRCICKTGFKLLGQVCEDIDECADSTDNCHVNADCTNTFGSFNCTCKTGFSGDGITCFDDDECNASPQPCDPKATCTNNPGSFNCTCDEGFTGNGLSCADIDECGLTPSRCHQDANCTNNAGSYQCECRTGFTGNGVSCTDVDECQDPTSCSNGQCNNFEGGFSCTCSEGYTKNNGTCSDIDECSRPNDCPANTICKNLPGLFRCDCETGYAGNPCTDIDECQTSNDCNVSATCNNTEGSYNCQCNAGYSGDGKTCDDIDECLSAADNDCNANTTCINIDGNFTCVCNTGFTGDGRSCADVDECASSSTNDCHANATCSNIVGNYTCQCNRGFTGEGRQCADIKECNGSPTPCSTNAECFEELGSFSCRCNNGYTGNGTVCTDVDECASSSTNDCHVNATCSNIVGNYTCQCNRGFTGEGRQCADIKECNGSPTPCSTNAECFEELGSFSCRCNNGYTGNGTVCTDVDECASSSTNDCHANATCSNIVGNYTCQCNRGFTGEGRQCADIKECNGSPTPCSTNAECFEELGSFSCRCNNGYTGNGTVCTDVDECASNSTNNCHPVANCSNTIGSFSCQCNVGFSGNGQQCNERNECSETPSPCPSHLVCENLYATHRCKCLHGQLLIGGQCRPVLVFNLRFTIFDGATYTNDLSNRNSEAYLLLQKNLESSVNNAYGASSISGSFLQSHLENVSRGASDTIMASFSVFIQPNVTGLTLALVGTHFTDQLTLSESSNIRTLTLEPIYVLYRSEAPATFDRNRAATSDDYNECAFNPEPCDSNEMCINYPGTHRCYCRSPRQINVNDNCIDVITYEGNMVILNLNFIDELSDPTSLQFLQLAETIQLQLDRHYRQISNGYLGSRVTGMRSGSVIISYIATFKPGTSLAQIGTLDSQLENTFSTNANGTFMGPYQIEPNRTQHSDYNECAPQNHVHVQDCDVYANCTNKESTYSCNCKEGYRGDGFKCTALPNILEPIEPNDDQWWIVYAVVFGTTFLIICMFILIVCALEHAEDNRYSVDDGRLIGEKNKYFFNGESMGIVNQDVELAPRNGRRESYPTTTPTRMESYKVNPMFHETRIDERHGSESKESVNTGEDGYLAL